jgi:hypothetical protein
LAVEKSWQAGKSVREWGHKVRLFKTVLLVLLVAFLSNSTSPFGVQAENASSQYFLVYTIDRTALPHLYYRELTLTGYVGPVSNIQASTDLGPLEFDYDPAAGTVTFTTAANVVRIFLENPSDLANAGPFSKAALKYDKKWAWSHGLDDNRYLWPSIHLFANRGWRATLYLIGKDIHDTRREPWIIDAPDIRELVDQGWGIGNHTWDHVCAPPWIDDPTFMRETILNGYNRLQAVIDGSPAPPYRLIAFAAPCFRDEYHAYIQEIKGNGQTAVLFNESGNSYRLNVTPGAGDYSQGGKTAVAFTYEMPVGRDTNLEMGATGVAAVKAEMGWLAANATPGRRFWYNTLSHGHQEDALAQVVDYAYITYGPGGSNEVWVAPADEIYSYLLTRDHSQVSYAVVGPLNERFFLPLIRR